VLCAGYGSAATSLGLLAQRLVLQVIIKSKIIVCDACMQEACATPVEIRIEYCLSNNDLYYLRKIKIGRKVAVAVYVSLSVKVMYVKSEAKEYAMNKYIDQLTLDQVRINTYGKRPRILSTVSTMYKSTTSKRRGVEE